MGVASKISALLLVIGREDIEQLPPVERRRLADLCRHIAPLAEPEHVEPCSGVLGALRAGHRDE
jgi:hypothetical protein